MKKFDKFWLDSINSIIEEQLANPDFQLINIATTLEISQAKLYRKVSKLTGLAPSRYIKKKRLERAKEMLEIGTYSTVKETAKAVGFRSPEYFSNTFSKAYQKTPSQVLKSEHTQKVIEIDNIN